MADQCLRSAGIDVSAEAVGAHYGSRSEGPDGLLDAWLVDTLDAATIAGLRVVNLPLLMPTPAEATALAAATLEVASAVG
jgi:LPPG:FO 2-phospho-L-lactate transferase